MQSNSVPDECTTAEEYDAAMHTSVYQAIKNLLSSEHWRRDFQQNCLLDYDKSLALWESLAENVENYVVEIRKLLPIPQLEKVITPTCMCKTDQLCQLVCLCLSKKKTNLLGKTPRYVAACGLCNF